MAEGQKASGQPDPERISNVAIRPLPHPMDGARQNYLVTLSSRAYGLVLGLMFTTGLAIRIYGIGDLPLDFHPARQYHSALIARGYYYAMLESVPEWKMAVAQANLVREGILEPPLMERIAALGYWATAREQLWIPRLLSSLFWLVGGIFLHAIARRLQLADVALITTGYYLLVPFGVTASQSFQPEPLMIVAMLGTILTIIYYNDLPSLPRLLAAALVSALAILIKPNSLFPIFGAFVSLAVYRQGVYRTIQNPATWLFASASLLPASAFYGYNFLSGDFFRLRVQRSFIPELLFQPYFWDGWLKRIRIVMGFTAFLAGMLGALLFRKGPSRTLIIGLWAGYFTMTFIFNYHIHTHDYYHLPLIPIVALSLGGLASPVIAYLKSETLDWYSRLAIWALLGGALFLGAGTSVQARRKLPDYQDYARMAREIGEVVDHSTRTVILEAYDGTPLEYHGEFSGDDWPHRYDIRDAKLWGEPELSAAERLQAFGSPGCPQFFVITDLQEFEAQPDLKAVLTVHFSTLAHTAQYIVFDLRATSDSLGSKCVP